MEFCNGGSLWYFIEMRGGKLDEKEAHYILKQLVNGLQAQNDKKVMHRDLKLENVGIVIEGEQFDSDEQRDMYMKQFDFALNRHKLHVKIFDYGLAKQNQDVTSSLMGTPLYSAPEILL